MKKHPVVFAGAGPGAPDLITVRAMRALSRADYVLYTGSLVPEAVLQWARPGAIRESSAGLRLEQLVEKMAGTWDQGGRVVRLHTGDPSLYGAMVEQIKGLEELSIPCEVIPGVTAAFAAAAALKTEYTVPGLSQTLIFTRISGKTPVPEKESLLSLARHQTALAIYLSAGMAGEVAGILAQAYGPQAACGVAYKVSHPEETIIITTVEQLTTVMAERRIRRHALILAGPFLEKDHGAASLLYDGRFSHGYRNKS